MTARPGAVAWPAGIHVIKLELPPPVPVRRMGLAWMTQGPRAALARAVLKEAEGVWGRRERERQSAAPALSRPL